MSQDVLLQTFTLKNLRLKNRVFSACHEPNISENGMPTERYRLYHEEKCKGGIGLCMFGGSSNVSKDSEDAFGNLDLTNDNIIEHFQKLADTVHKYDVPLICQITHMGRRNNGNQGNWLPVVSASATREYAHRAFPKELEIYEIKRITDDYVASAIRCQKGGLDGIELECYGHLMDSFLSPLTNLRQDEYGITLENRMRFALEVIAAIREALGDDFVIGIRMVFDELQNNGIMIEEGIEIAKIIEKTGHVDYFNVIIGHIDTDVALSEVIPNMGTPVAPHIQKVKKIKESLKLPILHSARINDVATARHCIKGGFMDLVGMTRAHFADPHLMNKIQKGEEDRIRPCVGASFCLDRIYKGGAAYCIHNPATLREKTMPHIIVKNNHSQSKHIVVIGSGTAGLEAARVSASRGHKVTLFEAQDKPGGQVILAAKLARRAEMIGIIDWLYQECCLLGVEFEFNHYAEANDILALNADIVIDATGGIPNQTFVEGGELAISTWDILSANAAVAKEAIIYDESGDHPALSCAEYMLANGCVHLHFITRDRMLAHELGGNNYPPYYKILYQNNVNLMFNSMLVKIKKEQQQYELTFNNEYSEHQSLIKTQQIIIEHGTLPINEVYNSLKMHSLNLGEIDTDALINNQSQNLIKNKEGLFRLYRVGDAVSSRNIHAAIYDSLRLCNTF